MNQLGRDRRLYYRDGLSLSEIERRTGLTDEFSTDPSRQAMWCVIEYTADIELLDRGGEQ